MGLSTTPPDNEAVFLFLAQLGLKPLGAMTSCLVGKEEEALGIFAAFGSEFCVKPHI